MAFNVVFLVRRVFIVTSVVFLYFNIMLSTTIFVWSCLFQLGYLLNYFPFHVKHQMRMEIYNEIMTAMVAYMFLTLARISEQGIFLVDEDGFENL